MANSGAEANEAAIKLARIHSGKGRYEIISLSGSFHGRTLATVAATGQPKFQQGFEPMPAGFVHAGFGDPDELEKLITPRTCAILCEPLQGESGVRPLTLLIYRKYGAFVTSITCFLSLMKYKPEWDEPAPCSLMSSWASLQIS